MKAVRSFFLAAAVFTVPLSQAEQSLTAEDLLEAYGVGDVFRASASGSSVTHIRSGLTCPLTFGSTMLWDLSVYPSEYGRGADVGCDYIRQSATGKAGTKLTLFAVKVPDDTTLDAAFEKYRQEVRHSWPDAIVLGPAIKSDESFSEELKAVRTEEYSVMMDGRRYQSDLIVFMDDRWVVEIRCTTLMQVPPEEAAVTGQDLTLPSAALLSVLSDFSD